MTKDEIATHAFNGTFPDKLMNLPQMLLYMTVRCIALSFRFGLINRQTATQEKNRAFADFAGNIVDWQNNINAMADKQKFIMRVELAADEYRKHRTIENADKVLEAIYGQPLC